MSVREAVEALRSKLGGNEDIEVRVLPTRYPQGAKKQLILAVTGREVAPGARTGALFNVTTIYSICRAVYEGLPLTEKVVTVTGEGANEPKNVIVRIGTPLEELLKFAGGMKEETCKVVCGGPMMGTAQGDLSVPVVKGTNAVLCLTDPAPAADLHPLRQVHQGLPHGPAAPAALPLRQCGNEGRARALQP